MSTAVDVPKVEMTAIATRNPGSTMIDSVMRMRTNSTLPRITPAVTPTTVARARASTFGTMAIVIATRAPCTIREKKSRPRASVPSRKDFVPGGIGSPRRLTPPFWMRVGSVEVRTSGKIAQNAQNATSSTPMMKSALANPLSSWNPLRRRVVVAAAGLTSAAVPDKCL